MGTLKTEYREALALLAKIKKYILVSAGFFILSAVGAYFVSMSVYSNDSELIKEHLGIFQNIIDSMGISDESGNIDAIALFFNNFRAAMMAIGAGLMPFIFSSMFNCISNGAVLGILLAIMHSTKAGGIMDMVISIAPHGVFEIPALVISIAFGLKLCAAINSAVMAKSETRDVFLYIAEMARVLVLVVVPLLVAAALVESYVTPVLINNFIN